MKTEIPRVPDMNCSRTVNQKRVVDWIALALIVIMLSYSAILLLSAFRSGVDLGEWIWDRHQNLFSWYSRPLFIIPACYYAYQRKLGYVLGFLALLATSLFWFAPPAEVSETVSGYLEWERRAFLNPENRRSFLVLFVAVCVFLFSLFYAFWQRNLWYGLIVFNIGNITERYACAVSIADQY